jgi:aminoglycoside phosphotransferase family enzyme/predicted kinase
VYLAGRFAYKIKKPVDLGFVDFTRIEGRRRACREEYRLNRRLAKPIYVGVVPIVRVGRTYLLNTRGCPVDYAVKMKRFDERRIFSNLLAAGELGVDIIESAADRLALFHRCTSRSPPRRAYGSANQVQTQVHAILAELDRESAGIVPAEVRAWCGLELARLAEHIDARRAKGFVRECHGDLHLENVVLAGRDILMFDCIEFSEVLRWIDVVNDLAFLCMDLRAHDRPDLETRLLNRWLLATGDFAGLRAIRLYIVYRALVRALVETLKARSAEGVGGPKRASGYLQCAVKAVRERQPCLLLCHGYSGSGKSAASTALAPLIGAIRLSSDIERKRAAPFAPLLERSLTHGAYLPEAVDVQYARLLNLAHHVLEAGYCALVDASFLYHEHRSRFVAFARSMQVPLLILDFRAAPDCLQRRVRQRAMGPYQPSDADETVLALQLANADPLTREELSSTVVFDTDVPIASFEEPAYWSPLLARLHHGGALHDERKERQW